MSQIGQGNCYCCNNSTICNTQSYTSCCSCNVGYSLLWGSQTLIQYVAPMSGIYVINYSLTGGTQPNSVSVTINGTSAGNLNPQGGSISLQLNAGDIVAVSVGWGVSYWGGSFTVCITQPTPTPTPTPSPTPSPSPTNPIPWPSPSSKTDMMLIVLLLVAIVVIVLWLLKPKRVS